MRIGRRLVRVLLVVLTLVIGATAAVAVTAETSWFKDWLRGYIVREARQYVNGEVSISRLGGNLFFGLELSGINLSLNGNPVIAVQNLNVKYSAFELITKGLSIEQISLNQAVIYLRRDGDTWSVAQILKKQAQEADRQGPASPAAIRHIGISDAAIVIDDPAGMPGVNVPSRIEHIDADLSFKYEPVRYSVDITHVSFRAKGPDIGLNALSGGIAVKDDTVFFSRLSLRTEETSMSIDGAVQQYLTNPQLNLKVSSDKFSLPEIARLAPSVAGIALQPAFEIALDGPLDRLGMDVNVRSAAGQLTGKFVADTVAPGQGVSGEMSVTHLDLAPLTRTPANKSDLTLDAKMDVKAADAANLDTLSGSASVTSPRVAFAGYAAEDAAVRARFEGRRVVLDANATTYGAAARSSGTVTIPRGKEPVAYDIVGTVRHLDVRKLPAALNAPPVTTDINAAFKARGAQPMTAGQPATMNAEVRFADSTSAGMHVAPGSVAKVAIRGRAVSYQADVTVTGADVERAGRELGLPALADSRYESNLNAHVIATGRGTTLKNMELEASGTITDSLLFGGQIPQAAFAAEIAGDRAHGTAYGDVVNIDPSVASGRPQTKGHVSGSFDVDASVDGVSAGATRDNVDATLRATLEPSQIGDIQIASANVDADYEKQRGYVRDFDMTGRDLNMRASGPIALDETGRSQLVFHADTPDLAEVGKLAGIPIAGIGRVDGTVTGNRTSLQAAGTLVGDGIKYGEDGATSALTASSKYTITIPDLDYTCASVEADTAATFVTFGGQEINELAAKTTYQNQQITFSATAKQPKRTLAADGAVAIRPDAREIRLQQFALDTEGRHWALAPGSPATIQYSPDAVVVNDVRLVSGEQTISATGAFGRPADKLTVTADNIDVANVDALLLRPPQLTGRMNASAVVSGTGQAPHVKANFQVAAGGFRQFHYDTLGGTAEYDNKGTTVDARLQQNSSQWLTAKGYLPTALFSGTGDSSDRVDFAVDSSPVDLGIVQGFTTQLTGVGGTLEAHVKVGGTAAAPLPSGTISVQNGTAKVEQTSVVYNHIVGKVDLQPERVHIDEITALDDNNNALSITGDLAVHAGRVGNVEIFVNADDFKLLKNKIGDVHVQTSLEITGDLVAPRVTGDVTVNKGKIDLDEAMALAGATPYATRETQYDAAAVPATGPYGALTVDVGLSVPDDFVVKASNLQTPGAPIGLGALNVTLGGDLHVSKLPGDVFRLRGTVNTVRGTYDFQGRRFDILRDGTVKFTDLAELDPSLDIRTERLIQGVTAFATVRGTMNKPEIVLTSTPPLDQADILSLIVFNQPLNSVSEGQQISLAARAQAMAAGAATSQLAQSIGNALSLDQFEINLAPENGGGPQVTLGQQLGQNLYVKVQQGVGDETSTNLVLEYELTKWLRLQSNVVQGASTEQTLFRRAQGSGIDLIFFFSY